MVSDIEFPRHGDLLPEAGFELARMVRGIVPDVPIVLQSSRTEFMERAHAEGFEFLQQALAYPAGRPAALPDRTVGLWRFRLSRTRRREVARATDLNELETPLQRYRKPAWRITRSATIFRTG